jgi:hypothetical protein
MTPDEELKISWLKNLRHAWRAWDLCAVDDTNGRVDIQRRIRKCEAELATLGVGQAEIAAYNVAEDARERAARKIRAIEAYDKSGLIVSEQ